MANDSAPVNSSEQIMPFLGVQKPFLLPRGSPYDFSFVVEIVQNVLIRDGTVGSGDFSSELRNKYKNVFVASLDKETDAVLDARTGEDLLATVPKVFA